MYSGDDRYLYLKTPLGKDVLQLASFQGREALNRPFEFQLECMAERNANVDFARLIGQKVSFGVNALMSGKTARDLNGIVMSVSQGGRGEDFIAYQLTVVPEIWKLSCQFRSRIFQHLSVPDVLKKVLEGYQVDWKTGDHDVRNYVVQYRESDLDFAARLMEEEGIFYYFRFGPGEHSMVVGDAPSVHIPIPGEQRAKFVEINQGGKESDAVHSWTRSQNWGSGTYTLWDSHFQKFMDHFGVNQPVLGTVKAGKISHRLLVAGNQGMEVYDYPGGYVKQFDGIDRAGGEDLLFAPRARPPFAKVRAQQGEVAMMSFHGQGNIASFTAGHKFTLAGHFNADDAYVLTEVAHEGHEGAFRSGHESVGDYRNSFACIPLTLPFAPARVTRKPVIVGAHTAIVGGPSGEEIFTDKYGRVKVQFPWDREFSEPDHSGGQTSCWVRVASHAGGALHSNVRIPRIGEEVIVTFLEGDPDQPIITGSVFNNVNMPPYTLPDRKTVSTIKSRSTPKGGADNYNEFRFEDKKGEEQLFLQAEKNLDIWVKNDQAVSIGQDTHETVGRHSAASVGQNMELTVGQNSAVSIGSNADIAIGANRTEAVGAAYVLSIGTDQTVVCGENHALDAAMDVHLKAGMNVVIEAGVQLTLKGPGGFITIDPSGVSIQGTMVLINSGGAAGAGKGAKKKEAIKPKIKIKKGEEGK